MLQINLKKKTGLWLGVQNENPETSFNIVWPKTPVKLLGVFLSYDTALAIKYNFDDRIEKLKKQLHWWKARDLSLIGRVLNAKTLALPKFSLLCSLINVPAEKIKVINRILFIEINDCFDTRVDFFDNSFSYLFA